MQAKVTMYSCSRDKQLPLYRETARIRMGLRSDLAVGDTLSFGGNEYQVVGTKQYLSACRLVVDVERNSLDESSATEFTLLERTVTSGNRAHEGLDESTKVTGVIVNRFTQASFVHDSRQRVDSVMIYLRKEDASLVTVNSVLRSDKDYKVTGIHDLESVPYVTARVMEAAF